MYCSEAAFNARFNSKETSELLPEDGDRTYPVAASDADSLIDSYLGGRYTVPFVTAPKLIVGIAGDIARYKLYDEAPPKEVAARYKDALKLLEQLRDGDIALPGSTLTEAAGVQVSAPDLTMTECVKRDFIGCL